ncbi:MAG: sensor diguanylate cyclase [Sphingomonadales bacterium]|nr:sensor diguanylate cyclase [Sphingomonadales bacterium]
MKHWSSSDASATAALSLIAEHSSDVIARVRSDMTFNYISPSAERLFLRPVRDTLGHHVTEFILPDDLPLLADASKRIAQGEPDITVTLRVIRGDGSLIWVEVASRLITDLENEDQGDRAVIMRDVSDRKALEDELRAMAMKDGLTGLANRRAFDEALLTEWKRTVREKSQMSLILIDIDNFKIFNDAYGHQVGDDCLRAVAAALQPLGKRPGDLVARYGGEELAIILSGSGSVAAEALGERARSAVEQLGIPQGDKAGGVVTISVGAATALARDGGSAEMPQTLLSSSDRALYLAKNAGRNCVRTTLLLATPSG